MILAKSSVNKIQSTNVINVPNAIFDLPEKVLQFGTGVLLRGLPDYFIDKANKQGVFNGRIVVVKSTSGGDATVFKKQDNLYTLCIRGIENGITVNQNIICSPISRVLSATEEWDTILQCAHNPSMQIIISNTTEVGIELVNEDIHLTPPNSYPAKLLAFLYERFKAFNGTMKSGMVIVPTELISDNGKKLKTIVTQLAKLNNLEASFVDWLNHHNHFCNSLVDRIVPGKPNEATKQKLEEELGYTDELLMMSEVYSLWAIQGDEKIASILSFATADKGVVITRDITVFKELKLRMLNGTHSLSCAIAFLSGIVSVKEAMDDKILSSFINNLMTNEIAKAIPYNMPLQQALTFANAVLDRFSNPNIEHHWINISLNYTAKLEMRIVQVLLRYVELYKTLPQNIALGFSAYLVFMKPVKVENGFYYGNLNGADYLINDPKVAYFFEQWQNYSTKEVVENVLSNTAFWNTNLATINGFAEKVVENVEDILQYGMQEVMANEKVKN